MHDQALHDTEGRVDPKDLEAFCVDAMLRCRLRPAQAHISAEVLVTNDTWGVHTHGTRQLRFLMDGMRAGRLDAAAEPEVVAEGGAWALIDGHHAMPPVSACFAMQAAIRKARAVGVGYAGVRRSGHFAAAGFYAVMAARENMFGLATSNADPIMTAPGARGRVIGTNPIAWAAPAGEERPIFLDVASSAQAATKVLAAADTGAQIPDTWLVDADGLPTTDPTAFFRGGAVLPFALHKGFGFALMAEILSAVLTGAGITKQVPSWQAEGPNPTNQGHAFIAIDVQAIMPLEEFKARMDGLIREIHSTPVAPGVDRVYVPGEKEWERREDALARGLALPEHVVASLARLAQDTGLEARFWSLFG